MLVDLTLLLHEVTDALTRRGDARHGLPRGRAAEQCGGQSGVALAVRAVLVTGTASPGKARLVAALARALPDGLAVEAPDRPLDGAAHDLHVHAASDIDALLESGPGSEGAWARRADLLVSVDWESTAHSVRRVIDALIARGAAAPGAGA